jgi:hypothetical protein
MRIFWTAAALAAVAGSAMAAAPPPGWLVLKGKTSVDHVIVGGMIWNCKSNACTATQLKGDAALDICKALAAKVGPVARFSFKGAELAEADLAACNAAAKS